MESPPAQPLDSVLLKKFQPPDLALSKQLPAQLPDTSLSEELAPQLPDTALLEELAGQLPDTGLLEEFPNQLPDTALPEELAPQLPDTALLEELPDQLANTALLEELPDQLPDTAPPRKVGRPPRCSASQKMRASGGGERARRCPLAPVKPPAPSFKPASLPVPGRARGRPKKTLPAPSAPPVSRPVPAARPRSAPGSQTRKTLYLLGKILHRSTPLGFAKLPKLKMVLQKVLGIVEEEKSDQS